MAFRLGSVTVAGPAVQAALSGYSDLAMRRVARAHGAPYALNEVVIDAHVLSAGRKARQAFVVPDDDHPVGGQLMGSEPESFAGAARDMVAAGYDVVDINFGCPVSKALGRCRGGFLLSDPSTALEIVGRVLDAVAGRVPVTVKMRRGFDDEPVSEAAFYAILDGAFALGIAGVTVHGRTVRQRYDGPSDWSALARVKRHLGSRAMLGSGDLFSPFRVRDMIAATGVDGVTIARGCIGNPFIFAQTAELLAGRPPRTPALGAQRAAIEMHIREAASLYGDRAMTKVRRHVIQYAALHPDPIGTRDAVVRCRSLAQLEAAIARWYDGNRFAAPDRVLEESDLIC